MAMLAFMADTAWSTTDGVAGGAGVLGGAGATGGGGGDAGTTGMGGALEFMETALAVVTDVDDDVVVADGSVDRGVPVLLNLEARAAFLAAI
jgi:hypothetical protein